MSLRLCSSLPSILWLLPKHRTLTTSPHPHPLIDQTSHADQSRRGVQFSPMSQHDPLRPWCHKLAIWWHKTLGQRPLVDGPGRHSDEMWQWAERGTNDKGPPGAPSAPSVRDQPNCFASAWPRAPVSCWSRAALPPVLWCGAVDTSVSAEDARNYPNAAPAGEWWPMPR